MIPAIVLAAGKSTRMGRVKANLPVGPVENVENVDNLDNDGSIVHDTFLTRIVRTLGSAGIDDVIIVVGHEKESVLRNFAESGLAARFVDNPDYESGQLSSLLAGLRLVDRPGVMATLITLVDIPFVSVQTVRAVIERYNETHAAIVRPTCRGRHGHPLLVDRELFDRVRHADPTDGMKPVVRQYATTDGDVEVEDEGAFGDIDTLEDYTRALSVFERVAREEPRS